MNAEAQEQVVAELRRSAKYGRVCETALRRVAAWALERADGPADAVKRAKRKLHQVCGAFCSRKDLAKIRRLVETVTPEMDEGALREVCTKAMALQESTRERTGVLGELYGRVFQMTGRVESLCDMGCGLNPLAWPWMGLSREARYVALDIDCGLVDVVGEFFRRRGIAGEARGQDVLVERPSERFDVVLMMKLLASLDRQRAGGGFELLRSMSFRHAVVTYPTRSLGGRDVGMESTYGKAMRRFLGEAGWKAEEFVVGRELVFVIRGG